MFRPLKPYKLNVRKYYTFVLRELLYFHYGQEEYILGSVSTNTKHTFNVNQPFPPKAYNPIFFGSVIAALW